MGRQGTAIERVATACWKAVARHRARLGEGPVLLAVSGGADSLAMLLTAGWAPRATRLSLVAAHFSHGLRPDDEPEEAALVREVADSLGVPLVHGAAKVAPSEASAREARYAFLAEAAAAHGAIAVATAHTLDDQAETLLLRLTRGAGTRGAGAIRELSTREVEGHGVTLFRPLLHVERRETEAVCHEAGVLPAVDVTNRSVRYARNRLRLRVMPELERINPQAREALAHHAISAQEDEDLLEALAADAVQGAETWQAKGVSWTRARLAVLPRPLLVRVLQTAWRRLAGEGAALSGAQLQAMHALIVRPEGGETLLGRGMRFMVEQETCRIGTWGSKRSLASEEKALPVPGETVLGDWCIAAAAGDLPESRPDSGEWEAALDADRVDGALRVRARRPGDRFQPLGLTETVKLQDVLVNAKVPRGERDRWPLVESPGGIVWVPGVRIADWAKVTGDTKNVLLLKARRAD